MSKRKRTIAPRLDTGELRVSLGHGLPPSIKDGLRAIADTERRSMSWVLEEIIVDWVCGKRRIARPKYRTPKAK